MTSAEVDRYGGVAHLNDPVNEVMRRGCLQRRYRMLARPSARPTTLFLTRRPTLPVSTTRACALIRAARWSEPVRLLCAIGPL